MAGTYSLELQIFGVYTTDIPTLEIWEDGVLDSSHPALLTGSTISVTINYGGALPTSLEFRFNDGLAEGGRTIEVRSIRINDQYVNTGNYLSIDSLTNGGAAGVVDIATADFLAAPADPTGADFAGATALTAGADYYNRSFDGSNQILDGLAGNDGIVGGAGDDRIDGGAGDDRIIGGAGADFIFGNDDNDTIFGNADNDTIFGGDGNDRLLGGSGADEIHGGADDDIIRGGSGNDTLTGGTGVDNLGGGGGDDIMYGGAGQDFLSGSSGDDTLDGGGDEDTLIGGGGNDFLDGGDANDILGGNQGEDVLNGGDGDDQLFGGSDNDILIGGEDTGSDTLYGEGGDDNLDGGQGSDVLVGGSGADTLTGGDDNDFLHGNGLTTSEIAQILRANPTVTYNYQTNSFYEYVAGPTTWTAAQTAATTTLLSGTAGHLVNVTSAVENEVIYQLGVANGATSAAGGAGNRIWLGGSDIVTNGEWSWQDGLEAGIQFSNGSAAANNLYENWGGGQPNGGAGQVYTTMWFNGGGDDDAWDDRDATDAHNYVIEWDAGLMNDDNAVDIIDGGAGDDHIYGYGGDDVLSGGADNDLIIGGAGADTINGDAGNDSLYGGDGIDTINGNAGDDLINGGTDADIIDAGAGDDTINLANGDFVATEDIDGGADNDEIVLTDATTIDFTTGTITDVEDLTGSTGDDDVTYTVEQALAFTNIDLGGGGNDISRVQVNGTVDVTALGTPTVTNAENGFLTGSTGDDDLTISGAQLDALVFGTGTIDFDTGTADILRLTSTSADLNALGATDGSILGLEQINASTAGASVTIDLNGQTEDFTIVTSANGDTITGGAGIETVTGGAGIDTIITNAGADVINSDAGDDIITAGTDADTIDAGAGDDTINLANGDFAATEDIDGGTDNDNITLTDATTIDFTTGTITDVEDLNGSTGDDDVTYTVEQALAFTNIDLGGGGNDISRVQVNGTVDVTALGTPTVTNAENGFLTGSTGDDDLTISGAQLDALVFGTGTIDFDTGTADILRLTSTSADLNALGATDGSILGLEQINASTAGASVTIDLNGQTEDFTIVTSANGDTITGGAGIETVTGGAGIDTIITNAGADVINSDAGDDIITAGTDADTIDAGAGDDTINLANGDFVATEDIDGGADNDEIVLTDATTIDFTTGTITDVEDLTGSTGDDDVTYTVEQALAFTNIDLGGGGNDISRVQVNGTVDVTALGTPTVTNAENGFLTGSTGDDDLTISGAQLDALVFGTGTIDFDTGTADILRLTSTSADLNALGATDGSILGLEQINASTAGASVTIDLNGQTEDFTIVTSANGDTITGGAGIETVTGGAGIDTIITNAGADVINSDAGDDIITAGTDADTIDAGAGDDTINLANGDFAATEDIDGGTDNDNITLTDATTIDFTTGTITDVEDLNGSTGDDDVTLGITQFFSFNNIDYGTGTNTQTVSIAGVNDVTALSAPTVTNLSTGNLIASAGVDDLTITGAQLDALLIGETALDFLGDNDVLRLTSTSTTLNAFGATDGAVVELEEINASTAAATVTIDLNGQTEGFIITGSGSGDIITTGSGADTINSGNGNDTITSGAGLDTINGGAGADTINLANGDFAAGESIDGDTGTDEIVLTDATTVDFTTGTLTSIETLTGSTGDDDVTLGITQFFGLTDIDYGTGTNDQTIDASGTNDVTALTAPTVSNVSSSTILFSTGVDDLTITGAQLDAFTFGLTILDTLGDADVLRITSTSTALNAYGANDTNLVNLETISAATAGTAVNIDMRAQTEALTILASANGDTIVGGLGTDTITGGAGNDTINSSFGDVADTIDGGGGTSDTLTYEDAAGGIVLDLADATAQDTEGAGVDTVSNIENVTGSDFNDTLDGDANDNIIIGGLGDDEIEGHDGDDTLNGGGGTGDVVTYESAGSGVTVDLSDLTAQNTFGAGTDTLSNFENLIGSAFLDNLTGDGNDNIITGSAGNDIIDGGGGNDTILGGDDDDTLTGGDGDDTIYGATIIGQSGVETVIQTSDTQWHSVTFAATITNPVIKMSNMTNNDGDFYTVRVRSVTDSGFEFQIDEWDYLDGSRTLAEDISWLAIAAGTHTLDNGLTVEAGLTTATDEAFTTVTMTAFTTTPVVMSQVMTDNEASAVSTRNTNRNGTGTSFQLQMQEEEANANFHAEETVGWIAIEAGGSAADGFLVDETGNTVTGNNSNVSFGGTFANTPVVLHDQQTRDGGDTSYSQANGVSTTDFDVEVGEEQSANAETAHTTEVIGYYALNEGLLTAQGGGDNTITGGAGVDTLFGGDGADTFIFEALNAFIDNDILADFSAGENDVLDISDLITSGTPDALNIANYINFNDSSGTDTIIEVDGAGGGAHVAIATITGITGLDEVTLFNNGNIDTTP